MNWIQRIGKIMTGVLFVIAGIIFILLPDLNYMLLLLGLSLYLLFHGARMMIYYFTMARLMVGGKSILYKSIILLDLAIFTASMTSFSHLYLIIYLVGIFSVSGVVDILRSVEAKKLDAPEWKFKMAVGIFSIIIGIAAAVSGILLPSTQIPVYIYGGGLIWRGLTGIMSAFRKTDAIYIQ